MIQLITLMPLLEIYFPENLRSFIITYLQLANFKFDFMYNPFHSWGIINLSDVNDNPYNENFELNQIHSRALIVNYGTQLLLWGIIISLYIPISICSKCFKCKKFKQLKSAYEFGVLFTSFNEAFVEFALLSFLNITQVIYIYIYIYNI